MEEQENKKEQSVYKQINVTFTKEEFGKIAALCKSINIKSVSGFIKECFYQGLAETLDKKNKVIDLLNGKKEE